MKPPEPLQGDIMPQTHSKSQAMGVHYLRADMQHQKTIRGHAASVYCVQVDHAEKFVITGADDCVVKVWPCFLPCVTILDINR